MGPRPVLDVVAMSKISAPAGHSAYSIVAVLTELTRFLIRMWYKKL